MSGVRPHTCVSWIVTPLAPLPPVLTLPTAVCESAAMSVPYCTTLAYVASSVCHTNAATVEGSAGHETCTFAGVGMAPKVVRSPK